jgi:hypothetical protein
VNGLGESLLSIDESSLTWDGLSMLDVVAPLTATAAEVEATSVAAFE